MAVKIGEQVPSASLMELVDGKLMLVRTDDFFAGRTVVLFAVPGAFTPTCSARHLPGFVDKYQAIKAQDVDEIACLSVNDAFVMNAWGKAHGAGGRVRMLADGNREFTRAMGLEMDGTKSCLGMRSRRYSMVVKDKIVRSLNLEEPGAFEVSSADFLLNSGQLP